MKAVEFLNKAASLLEERGKQYDQPQGERSMGKAVTAFNAITSRDLSEAEGWLLLQLLKDVRQWQNPERYHADSAEDCVSYSALKAEALASQGKFMESLADYPLHMEPAASIDDDSPRAHAIGQNGNTGEHYGEAKPSWSNAPYWAKFLAQDLNGNWNWFDDEPNGILDSKEWMLDDCDAERFEFADVSSGENPEWRTTLEARPCQ